MSGQGWRVCPTQQLWNVLTFNFCDKIYRDRPDDTLRSCKVWGDVSVKCAASSHRHRSNIISGGIVSRHEEKVTLTCIWRRRGPTTWAWSPPRAWRPWTIPHNLQLSSYSEPPVFNLTGLVIQDSTPGPDLRTLRPSWGAGRSRGALDWGSCQTGNIDWNSWHQYYQYVFHTLIHRPPASRYPITKDTRRSPLISVLSS